jgi:hypothetical protein
MTDPNEYVRPATPPGRVTHHMGLTFSNTSPCGLDPMSVYRGFQGGFTTDWSDVDCPTCLTHQPQRSAPVVANPEVGAKKLRSWYVTFGVMYAHTTHPYWKGADPEGYLEVQAPDEDAARLLIRSFIGTKYAFIYDRTPEWAQNGRLATVTTNGGIFAEEGVEPPTPRFGPSNCQFYGVATDEVVGARIEGVLEEGSDYDALEKLGYEVELVHKRCLTEGLALFAKVYEVDSRVMAGELDYADPHECPVCETSIT